MGKTLELLESARDSRALSFLEPSAAVRIREELNRILSSRTFRSAELEKTFLRYVVDQTLQGRGAEIKEYTVGAEAFGRGDLFDPRLDTIVRTEARNVRLRLNRYYSGEGERDPLRIELPKGGYEPQFIESVSTEESSEPTLTDVQTPLETVNDPPVRNRGMLIGAACALVALLGFWLIFERPHQRPVSADPASIAVLPFVDLSASIDKTSAGKASDKEGEILSDGLTEQLIDSLARIPRLHVVARSSVFLYKGHSIDVRKAGRDLNVRNVLEGSVRVSNGNVRITARLEDATSGYQLWSQTFNRRLDDAVTLQDELAVSIMQSLGIQLAGAANLKTGASPSPAAYRDFLRGLYFLNRSTAENVRTSINYFQRAVAVDPTFAPAYRGLADAYSRIAAFTSTPSGEVIPLMRSSAAKALELDDTLGEAHLDLARAYTYESNWKAADPEYRRALDLSPSSAAVHRYYGDYLLRIGHLEEALAEARIAVELDPISPGTAQFEARMLYYLRRYDESVSHLQKALALDPSSGILHQALGLVYMARPASFAQGVAETERAREMMEGDPWITGQLGYAYAVAGRTAEAREIVTQLERGSGGFEKGYASYVRALPVARVYAGLGDRDHAFLWLQRAVEQKDVALFLAADPVYDGIRIDKRFGIVLHRANLGLDEAPLVSMR